MCLLLTDGSGRSVSERDRRLRVESTVTPNDEHEVAQDRDRDIDGILLFLAKSMRSDGTTMSDHSKVGQRLVASGLVRTLHQPMRL
jgi:hypothetical protein